MGHNYIGTEHLLLGVMYTGGAAAEAFAVLGLPPQRAEQLIIAELTAYQAHLQGQLTSMGRNRAMPEPGEPAAPGQPGKASAQTDLSPGRFVCTAEPRAAERLH